MDVDDLLPQDKLAHFAALLDAEGGEEDGEPQCRAYGPTGECCRVLGHLDGAWPINKHVTFDNDHYEDWSVGWRSAQDRIKTIMDQSFGRHVKGNADYNEGFQTCLDLVRMILGGK